MTKTNQTENSSHADRETDDACSFDSEDLDCCYVMDPCGCYVVDSCGCYVDPCCC